MYVIVGARFLCSNHPYMLPTPSLRMIFSASSLYSLNRRFLVSSIFIAYSVCNILGASHIPINWKALIRLSKCCCCLYISCCIIFFSSYKSDSLPFSLNILDWLRSYRYLVALQLCMKHVCLSIQLYNSLYFHFGSLLHFVDTHSATHYVSIQSIKQNNIINCIFNFIKWSWHIT